MPQELPVLSDQSTQIRAEIEDALLAQPLVSFVSVGFLAADSRAVLVSIGTERPDLVAIIAERLVEPVLRILHQHDPERAWNPDIHILKGRTRA